MGRTVLVADDEAPIRALVGKVLRDKGYVVLEAGDGIEALDLASRHDGPIHLLLTDWKMPRLGGEGLTCELSKARPEMAVLIMSGHFGEVGPPPHAYILPKPFNILDLVSKVENALIKTKPGVNGGVAP
jgi:DNA-binding NtrC family response regulator